MKILVLLFLLVLGALVWFRSGKRWSSEARGNMVSLLIFLIMLGGILAMILLAVRMF